MGHQMGVFSLEWNASFGFTYKKQHKKGYPRNPFAAGLSAPNVGPQYRWVWLLF